MTLRPSRFGDEFRIRLAEGAGLGWDNFINLAEEAFRRSPVEDRREGVAIAGAAMGEVYPWRGYAVDPADPLGWPRTGVYDDAGNEITGVPQPVMAVLQVVAGAILGGFAHIEPDRDLAELFRATVADYLDQGVSDEASRRRH